MDAGWERLKTAIARPSKELLVGSERQKRTEWITDEILDLMEQRRSFKNSNRVQYNAINRLIRRKVREAKEEHLLESCREIERLQLLHDNFHLHKQVKQSCGQFRSRGSTTLRNANGRFILDPEELCAEWTTYIQQLFDSDRDEPRLNFEESMTGPSILVSEVEAAIRKARNRKSPGPDEIPVELLKLLDEDGVRVLSAFFNRVYRTGEIPSQWAESTFIPLPKKPKPRDCGDFRLISLMSHTLKILLRVLQERIHTRCEAVIGDSQFGFRSGLGTREALFSMNILLQKCKEFQKPVFICFIDFEKAFDRVQHSALIEALGQIGLDDLDVQLLKNLYWNQSATVQVDAVHQTNRVPIKRGVRQGCVLSPMLFNVYSEIVFREALQDRTEGVRIGGECISNIRYADDTALLAESIEDLQNLVDAVDEACSRYGLTINISKTKFMVVSKILVNPARITVRGEDIERVTHFKYLGAWLNETVNPDEEIRARIEMARSAFARMKSILCCRGLRLSIRLNVLRCYVWSTLFYGCETWTLKVAMMNRLEAFEMFCYRRILRISWTQHETNENVLRRMHKDRELLRIVKRRKLEYFGHIIRGQKYSLLRNIIEGRIEGKRGIGRKSLSWLRNLRVWTNLGVEELYRTASDRDRYKNLIERKL